MALRTKNFTLEEIAHRPIGDDPMLRYCGLVQMGYMQCIRDYLNAVYGVPVSCIITSGYRELDYNRSIGSSDSSNHRWRVENGSIRSANDCYFYANGERLLCLDVFKELKLFWGKGEIYLNLDEDIIHISLQPKDEPSFFIFEGLVSPISEL
jgi:hypothetical protein